jgi:hypothetical protein
MAILVYYIKAAEDAATVTYRCGGGPEADADTLVFDKATRRVLSVSDDRSPSRQAAGRIMRTCRDTGEWPERGVYAA